MLSCKLLEVMSPSLLPLPLQVASPNVENVLDKACVASGEMLWMTLFLRNLILSGGVHGEESGKVSMFFFPNFSNFLILSLNTTFNLIPYFNILNSPFGGTMEDTLNVLWLERVKGEAEAR